MALVHCVQLAAHYPFFVATEAIRPSEPQAALLIQDGLALPAPEPTTHSRQLPDVGGGHPGLERQPVRSADRAAGGDASAPRRRHPAAPRPHAPYRRRGTGPARRNQASRGTSRRPGRAFPGAYLGHLRKRADGDRPNPGSRPAHARRGPLQRRAQARRRDGRGRGRRVPGERVPADRRAARTTRRASTVRTAGPGIRSTSNDRGSVPPGITPARPRLGPWPRSQPGSGQVNTFSTASAYWVQRG